MRRQLARIMFLSNGRASDRSWPRTWIASGSARRCLLCNHVLHHQQGCVLSQSHARITFSVLDIRDSQPRHRQESCPLTYDRVTTSGLAQEQRQCSWVHKGRLPLFGSSDLNGGDGQNDADKRLRAVTKRGGLINALHNLRFFRQVGWVELPRPAQALFGGC